MMFHYKHNKSGFSLIELMVVLAIVAVLMSLTGGLLQRNIAQQERIVEIEKINQLFHKLSYRAYYGAGPYLIRFQENKITIKEQINIEEDSAIASDEIIFNQLIFVAQDYQISSKGVISPAQFAIITNNDIRQFSFKALFNEATL